MVICFVATAIWVLRFARSSDFIFSPSGLRALLGGGAIIAIITTSLLVYAPRLLYFLRQRRVFGRWSSVFERKWLSLWLLVSSTETLARILSAIIAVSLIIWSSTVGIRLFQQSFDEAVASVEEEAVQLVESGEAEMRGSREEFMESLKELQSEKQQDLDETGKLVISFVRNILNTVLIPAILLGLLLDLAFHILIAAWSGQGRILVYIGIQVGVSAVIGFLAQDFARRLGIGTIGLVGVIYGILTRVFDALIPDYAYGFIWEKTTPCPYCDTEVHVSDRFCSSCGFRLSK